MPKGPAPFDPALSYQAQRDRFTEWGPYDPNVWRPHAGYDASFALVTDPTRGQSLIVKTWRAERIPGPPIVEPAEGLGTVAEQVAAGRGRIHDAPARGATEDPVARLSAQVADIERRLTKLDADFDRLLDTLANVSPSPIL